MQVEICGHKVILSHGNYYMSVWQDGTIKQLICAPDYIKDSNFNQLQERKFSQMWRSFINKDY